MRTIECRKHVLGRERAGRTFVEEAVVGFTDDGQDVREEPLRVASEPLSVPRDHRVAHDTDAAGAGEHDRPAEQSQFLDQRATGQLTRTVRDEHAGLDEPFESRPAGKIAVTPVRTGPRPTTRAPSPWISVW